MIFFHKTFFKTSADINSAIHLNLRNQIELLTETNRKCLDRNSLIYNDIHSKCIRNENIGTINHIPTSTTQNLMSRQTTFNSKFKLTLKPLCPKLQLFHCYL